MLKQYPKTIITGMLLFCSTYLYSQQTLTIPIDPLNPSGLNIAKNAIYILPGTSTGTVIKPTVSCPSIIMRIDPSNIIPVSGSNSNNVNYNNPIDASSKTINTSLPVGVINGSAGVSPGGAATYQIPIFCSPGTNGMQPNLSISYNSQSGYGSLGWGWDLFGTSSITRTSRTIIQDGMLSSVEMNGYDAFSIDGNRMYVINSGNHSPAGDLYYNTEFADFSSLYSVGYSGTGPLYFEKIETNGTVKQYGYTSSSRKILSSDNSVGVWRLNKVTDINGNYMTYNYNNAGLLSSIDYTGNAAANILPYNQIVFLYALRSDPNITYPGYSAALEDKYLLTEIQVKNETQLVKKYVFKYNYGSNDVYTLLNEIIESDNNGNELNSTVITWNNKLEAIINSSNDVQACNQKLFSQPGSVDYIIYKPPQMVVDYHWNHANHHPPYYQRAVDASIYKSDQIMDVYGDFNGDGYMDILEAYTKTSVSPHVIDWKVFLYNLTSRNYPQTTSPDASGTISNPVSTANLTLMQITSADVDGNGTDEIYFAIDDASKSFSGCETDSIDFVCYKFENSNLTPLTQYRINNLASRGITANSNYYLYYYISFMDLNGDGKENEMMFAERTNIHAVFLYNHIPECYPNFDCDFLGSANESLIHNADFTQEEINGKIMFTDINGNGMPEIMNYYPITGNKIQYDFIENDGNSLQQIYTMQLDKNFTSDSIHSGDFNGDGKTDFLVYIPDNPTYKWKLMISKGDGFETILSNNYLIDQLNSYTTAALGGEILCQDYNGDGKTDVLYMHFTDSSEPPNNSNIKIFYSYGRDFKMLDYGSFAFDIDQIPYSKITLYPVGDMNGDGNDDLLYNKTAVYGINGGTVDACFSYYLFINSGKKPLLVNEITDGFLRMSTVDYKPMSDPSVYTKGNNINDKFINNSGSSYLVSGLTQPDGIGGTSTTSYTYAGGIIHKYGKGLLGFSKVTAENNVSLVKTESTYELDPVFLMMNLTEAKTFLNNSTTPSSIIHNTYAAISLNGDNSHGYFKGIFPYISHSTITDNLTGIVVDKEFDYGGTAQNIFDNKGNIKTQTENYGSDGSVVTTNTFEEDPYTTANGLIPMTKLKEIEVVKTIGSETFTKNTGYTYNIKGLLENVVDFSNITNGAITTKYEYTGNYYGNITKKTVSASGMVDRYTLYDYDADYGRFLTKETNMLGQETHYVYNNKFGLKTSLTDILGNTTAYQYDGFGSLTQVNLPNGYSNVFSKHWYQNTSNPLCVYYTSAILSNAPYVETYYDAFGRELSSMTVGLGSIPSYTDKEYNAKGQLYRSCLPYRSGQTKKWITNTYDDNTNQLQTVDNYGLLTTYGYSGKTVTETDPDQHSKSKTINNMGLVVSATDPGGSISYTYHGSGAVAQIITGGSTITNVFDTHGRIIEVDDPDAGNSLTEYNSFGEITQQTDANGAIYTFEYDDAGRLEHKHGPEGAYNYTYLPTTADSCGGLLSSVVLNGESTTYDYTKYGQVLTETKVINSENYVFNYGYDHKGNKTQITYPNGFKVTRHYDNDGRLLSVYQDNFHNQNLIWRVDADNELGLPTQIRQGDNILNTTYTYDNYYHLSNISNLRQNDDYIWDPNNGNLNERTNNIKNLTETLAYDDMNRLTEIKLNNISVKKMSYSPNGNIELKTDAGAYSYDPTKVHAVLQIQDNNEESAISKKQQDVTYTAFNKIKSIVEQTTNGDSLVYLYGPDMQRNRMELYNNNILLKKRVYDGLYETEDLNNSITQYCYVEGGVGITAVAINKSANNTMYYLLRDQQGSITGLVDDNQNLAEEYSYDAWGRRRNPTNWTYNNIPTPQLMFRGYTMHEMLDDFSLINMNGRCYDPVVGRFLSPDIVIQDGNNTQCYNRYSYCINNPLKYNDPSGWSYNLLDQLKDNQDRANYIQMKMDIERQRLRMNMMPICNFENGGNSLAERMQFESDGNHHYSIQEIVNLLKIFYLPGVLGNPSDNEKDGDPVTPTVEPPGMVPVDECNQYKIEDVLINADLGLNGLSVNAQSWSLTGECPGSPMLYISVTYNCNNNSDGYYFKQKVCRDDEGVKDDERIVNGNWTNILTPQHLPDNHDIIYFEDSPQFDPSMQQKKEHSWTGELTLYDNNNMNIFTINYGYNLCSFGNGFYDLNVEPYNFILTKY